MGEKTSYAQVEISNCEVFPGVSINDIELKSSLSYGSFRFTGNNLPIFPEDEVPDKWKNYLEIANKRFGL